MHSTNCQGIKYDYTRRRYEQLLSEHPDAFIFLEGEYGYWIYNAKAITLANDILKQPSLCKKNSKNQAVMSFSRADTVKVCRIINEKGYEFFLDGPDSEDIECAVLFG